MPWLAFFVLCQGHMHSGKKHSGNRRSDQTNSPYKYFFNLIKTRQNKVNNTLSNERGGQSTHEQEERVKIPPFVKQSRKKEGDNGQDTIPCIAVIACFI